jgi:phospholipid transport system substrate-binding protein
MMMKRVVARITLIGALMFLAFNVWADCNVVDAEKTVKEATDEVLEALKTDSCQIYSLVNEVVLPHFDFSMMSRLVLGHCGRSANRTQKQEFANEFRQLLVRTYSTALVEAAGKVEKISYSSESTGTMGRKDPKPTAEVSAKVYQKGQSTPLTVEYTMYCDNNAWKAYNISVGGPSLVNNYRQEFCDTIRRIGMGGLIQQLKDNNKDKKPKDCKK